MFDSFEYEKGNVMATPQQSAVLRPSFAQTNSSYAAFQPRLSRIDLHQFQWVKLQHNKQVLVLWDHPQHVELEPLLTVLNHVKCFETAWLRCKFLANIQFFRIHQGALISLYLASGEMSTTFHNKSQPPFCSVGSCFSSWQWRSIQCGGGSFRYHQVPGAGEGVPASG